MKTSIATLAIVACAGILVPFVSVNGQFSSIKIISSDGSYIPGSGKSNLVIYFENIFFYLDTFYVPNK